MLKLNNVRSEKLRIVTGIPQGTVLGPLLFISYINPLLRLSGIGGMIISYADDTVLVFAEDTWEKVRDPAVGGLAVITNWLRAYKLSLNCTKTNYIAFSVTKRNRSHF